MRFLACLAFLLAARIGDACTTFVVDDPHGGLAFGKSYDWMVGDGILVVNKRNVTKSAVAAGAGGARWTSQHGSVSFNQMGRDQPSGGMNEKGLVIELMWLDGTRYPEPDHRVPVGCLEFIQRALDTCSTVEGVIAMDASVRISSDTPLHYLVADASGASASIEFLDGRLVARPGARVLANDTHDRSVRWFESAGRPRAAGDRSSLGRFCIAADAVAAKDVGPARERAFAILDLVHNGDYTKWQIVHEPRQRRISWRLSPTGAIRSVDLSRLDFGCAMPVLVRDLAAPGTGDVTAMLVPYTTAANVDLLARVFPKIEFLAAVPADRREALARHPDTATCAIAK